ncbi:MAG TPA: alginate export family protein [Bryobacteraceae bacterium]|nr:alginate export family protein [Bryobacteraceae bacterium]
MKTLLAAPALLFTLGACAHGQAPAPAGAAAIIESPASALNESLPTWLRFGGEYRARFEGYSGGSFKDNTSDDYLLSRLKLQMTIQPSKWLKLFAEGMDARALEKNPALPPYQNTWDVRQAYAEVGSFTKGIGLRVGRQELNYGEQRLIGSSAWTDVERVFDAAVVGIHHNGLRADLFTSSVVVPVTGTWDHHQQSHNLHGIYAGIDRFGPRLVIEPYLMWHLQHGLRDETGTIGKLDQKIGGFRIAGTKLPGGFDYSVEEVKEWGSLGSDKISTWAGHWNTGKTFQATLTPRVFIEYNYAAGDKNPTDGTRGTFDQLFPSGHGKYGLSDQVGWKNMKNLRGGLETKPRKNMTLAFEYDDWHLASATDALYGSSGAASFRSPTGSAGTHVGQELDVTGTWIFAKAFNTAVGLAHIFPGEFLKTVTPGHSYTSPYVMFTYRF